MVVNYSEGDWFAVPLPDGGYGVGLVARAQPKHGGVLLGYFFGPRLSVPPSIDQVRFLSPTSAIMVRLFGHLDIRQGRWPIIGKVSDWNREHWPMPAFIRKPTLGPAVLVIRSDDDPNTTVSEAIVRDEEDVVNAAPEGLLGSSLAAKLLAKKI